MATQSFDEDLIIDTPEKARRLIEVLKGVDSEESKDTLFDNYSLVEESDRVLLGKESG